MLALQDSKNACKSSPRSPIDIRHTDTETQCKVDPADPLGDCKSCAEQKRPKIKNLPCLRYNISEVALYREEKRPSPHWTKRWQNSEIEEITQWADVAVRRIRITQGVLDASYEIEVRLFEPLPGDSLHKSWTHNGAVKTCLIQPYAIIDMNKAFRAQREYLDNYMYQYIADAIHQTEGLIRNTYVMAYKYARETAVSTIIR